MLRISGSIAFFQLELIFRPIPCHQRVAQTNEKTAKEQLTLGSHCC